MLYLLIDGMGNGEWNGMEWNGMEWNGMAWHGMAWNGMEWNGMSKEVATTVEVNRNILGALLSFSAKASKPKDFDAELTYPLSAIPLSMLYLMEPEEKPQRVY